MFVEKGYIWGVNENVMYKPNSVVLSGREKRKRLEKSYSVRAKQRGKIKNEKRYGTDN